MLTALAATRGVITSAGLVLAGTFAALATLPVAGFAEIGFAEIGFAVAFGVLLDTMVVRSVLVTALTLDMRHRVGWPSRLDRPRTSALPAGEQAVPDPSQRYMSPGQR
ncbi:MMPL family transporter [Actinacidiphila glaucinigra]|uniref:MMPL family transporter n=1 Tax=Actinacidiphila glaucinigra TaxID=235986 RepID=UPI003D8D10D0